MSTPEAAGARPTGRTMIAANFCLRVFHDFVSAGEHKDSKDVMGTGTPKQQHFVVEQTHQSEQMGQCLGLDSDDGMDNLPDKHKQVFLVMPAKAAGSTCKKFTKNCMASAGAPEFTAHDNILNDNNLMRNAFKHQVELPSLVASHLHNAQRFQSLTKHATKDTLITHSHREETSRFKSAAKHVIGRPCWNAKKEEGIEPLENECRVTESELLKRWSKPQRMRLESVQNNCCRARPLSQSRKTLPI